jgi:hypothetical protein
MRRVRQDKHTDGLAGLKILSGHYKDSKEAAELLGYRLTKRDYLSIPVSDLRSLPPELQQRLKI